MLNLDRQSKVIAVLGPTTTGKTFFAMERLLSHRCGIIGFPLRLLARENYDKAVLLKGRQHVALITGEEKIIPDQAKYYFCTVESKPGSEKNIDFIAIDEVQLCADPERGHLFTDRLLHMRGRHETLFLGSAEIKQILKELISNIKFITRPRFSKLTYSGKQRITRLKPRSAVVGFSSEQVYSVAELIRRQRGGAAIVMGALSPRTRNAQVEMFQNGDVDYLVATDAIGMGLNMDVDHIGFASLSKFDGILRRDLEPRELAQIAGRSGRYTRDGTFGVTCSAKELDPLIATQIETHSFKSIRRFQWRNSMLDYSSSNNLKESLTVDPPNSFLKKIRRPNDEKLLFDLLKEKPIAERLGTASAI